MSKKEWKQDWIEKMEALKHQNLVICGAYLLQGCLAVVLAYANSDYKGVKIPIKTSFIDFDRDVEPTRVYQNFADLYDIPLLEGASLICFSGALMHFLNWFNHDEYE